LVEYSGWLFVQSSLLDSIASNPSPTESSLNCFELNDW
jgi:hypothetical protein